MVRMLWLGSHKELKNGNIRSDEYDGEGKEFQELDKIRCNS